MKNAPQTEEWKKADAALRQIDHLKQKRAPSNRHDARMKALYVGPISDTEWNRPADTSRKAAYEFLVDAVNEYQGRYRQGYPTPGSTLRCNDAALDEALRKWKERPVLPPPENPEYPS